MVNQEKLYCEKDENIGNKFFEDLIKTPEYNTALSNYIKVIALDTLKQNFENKDISYNNSLTVSLFDSKEANWFYENLNKRVETYDYLSFVNFSKEALDSFKEQGLYIADEEVKNYVFSTFGLKEDNNLGNLSEKLNNLNQQIIQYWSEEQEDIQNERKFNPLYKAIKEFRKKDNIRRLAIPFVDFKGDRGFLLYKKHEEGENLELEDFVYEIPFNVEKIDGKKYYKLVDPRESIYNFYKNQENELYDSYNNFINMFGSFLTFLFDELLKKTADIYNNGDDKRDVAGLEENNIKNHEDETASFANFSYPKFIYFQTELLESLEKTIKKSNEVRVEFKKLYDTLNNLSNVPAIKNVYLI